ncbi:MAG: hypothetical protein E6J93_00620 [Methanobacteriota archaeon]|nr:MAG: hypothetical protein E6J93_00620 [Euryarchaeota archaeon]
MIPVPPPGDVLPTPEPTGPVPRGGEPTPPLVLHAFDEIENLKRVVVELQKRLEALEHRLAGMDALQQRIAALENAAA